MSGVDAMVWLTTGATFVFGIWLWQLSYRQHERNRQVALKPVPIQQQRRRQK